jgi:hypothetical protein
MSAQLQEHKYTAALDKMFVRDNKVWNHGHRDTGLTPINLQE